MPYFIHYHLGVISKRLLTDYVYLYSFYRDQPSKHFLNLEHGNSDRVESLFCPYYGISIYMAMLRSPGSTTYVLVTLINQ